MNNETVDALIFLGFISFISNVLPGSLEVVLTVFIHKHSGLFILGWVIAVFFNASGAAIIFLLSNKIPNHKKIPARTEAMIHKYGSLSLLFVGIPFVGDVLPLAAGFFKLKVIPSVICLFIGKSIRYGLMVLFLEYAMHKI